MLWLGVGMQPSEREGESSAGAAMQPLGARGSFLPRATSCVLGLFLQPPLLETCQPDSQLTPFCINYSNKSLFLFSEGNYSAVHQRNGHSLGLPGRHTHQYMRKAAGTLGIPPAASTVPLD